MNCKEVWEKIDIICPKCFYYFLGACKPQHGQMCLGKWCEMLAYYMLIGGEY